MDYLVDRIVRDVRLALEHDAGDDDLLAYGDTDASSLEAVIISKAADGARIVAGVAPHHLLDAGVDFTGGMAWDDGVGQGAGYVILPDDFLRLVSFRMSDWQRPVTEPIVATDPAYLLQSSPYKGLRGCPERPVCAIVQRPVGLVLEFYSSYTPEAYIKQARYIPMPHISDDSTIGICQKCYRPTIMQIAALTAYALGAEVQGDRMSKLTQDLLTWQPKQ